MYTEKLNFEKIKSLYWDKELDVRAIASKLGISFWSLYNFMNKNNIIRRSPSEVNYVINRIKPQFRVKENLTISEEKLKIAGIMLYWAEGTLKGNTVDFANSNPRMIKIFLKFLRDICGIREERLRIYIYAYPHQDIKKIKLYWHRITDVNLNQFTKPYIRRNNPNFSRRKLPYGLIHIRYNDKRLLEWVGNAIFEYIKWAGTQAAKGGRLSRSSVLLKDRVEK